MWRRSPRHSDYERQPAAPSRFEPSVLDRRCRDKRHGVPVDAEPGSSWLVGGNEPEYRLARHEEVVLRRTDAPSLTITSDPYNSIFVLGGPGPDWKISLCASGAGATEAEARERLNSVSMRVTPGTVSVLSPGLFGGIHQGAELIVEGPADADLVIHASYASVEVRDMRGRVRIAASHATANVLNAGGDVDATAMCVNYSGSSGRVTLGAELEINLRIGARKFDGRIISWAQRSVHVLLPAGFQSSLQAVVGHRDQFVCRTDLATPMRAGRQGELHVFTNLPETSVGRDYVELLLRSEASTVVIDNEPPTARGDGTAGALR